MLGLSQHSIRMDWKMMDLCKSVGRLGKWGFMEIVGIGVLDVGLCSDKCKLKEVVCPFENLVGIEFTRECEKGWGRRGVIQKVMDD